MENRSITDFLGTDYLNSSLYTTFRNFPSAIDGLRFNTRKIIYAELIKDKGLSKVSALAGNISAEMAYIHGQVSMEESIIQLNKDYCGSNNVPLLKKDGSFGTRFSNDSAASRYIFSEIPKYFKLIFKPEDTINLIKQNFEGQEVEPRYLIPTFPVHLVNGLTGGLGSGFRSEILGRKLENILTLIKDKLNNKKYNSDLEIPGWRNFKGTVNRTDLSTKWNIKGVYKKDGCIIEIDELPIRIQLMEYLQHLKELKNGVKKVDKKTKKEYIDKSSIIIQKYEDFSENDNYKFKIYLTPEAGNKSIEELEKDLWLSTTENEYYNCIDSENKIIEFSSFKEMFDYYYNAKIEMLEKRKLSEIERLTRELNYLSEIARFILGVVKNKINVKAKKADLEKQLTEMKFTIIPKLISLPILTLTEEKVEEIKRQVEKKNAELEEMKKQTAKSLWLRDIKELELELKKEGILD